MILNVEINTELGELKLRLTHRYTVSGNTLIT